MNLNCCEAWWLRSRLIQVAYVTSLGCLSPKPASFEVFGCKYVCKYVCVYVCVYVCRCMYITASALISSTALGFEALSFVVNRFREKTKERSEHKQSVMWKT